MSPPTRGNLLKVAAQINVDWRVILLPQQEIIVVESAELQLRQRETRTGQIVEIEKLLAIPCRNCCSHTMPQGVELHIRILKQLICETAVASQARYGDVAA